MSVREMLVTIAAFPPYAGGWLVGKIVLLCRFLWRAVQVGYLDSIGDEAWRKSQQVQ